MWRDAYIVIVFLIVELASAGGACLGGLFGGAGGIGALFVICQRYCQFDPEKEPSVREEVSKAVFSQLPTGESNEAQSGHQGGSKLTGNPGGIVPNSRMSLTYPTFQPY